MTLDTVHETTYPDKSKQNIHVLMYLRI